LARKKNKHTSLICITIAEGSAYFHSKTSVSAGWTTWIGAAEFSIQEGIYS